MLTFGNDDPWSPSGLKATCNVSALYMLLHGPCARKHRVRAVVTEALQSVVIEAQQRKDTEKIRGVDVARGITALASREFKNNNQ